MTSRICTFLLRQRPPVLVIKDPVACELFECAHITQGVGECLEFFVKAAVAELE